MRNCTTLLGRDVRISARHLALDVHRALNGVDRALELDQHAVAGRLDEPPAVRGDGGIDHFEAMRFQARKRARLVGFHEPAVAGHVGREDGCQTSLAALRIHRTILRGSAAGC
jgi:hypothetical protein